LERSFFKVVIWQQKDRRGVPPLLERLREEVSAAVGHKYLFRSAMATEMPPPELPGTCTAVKVNLKIADLQSHIRSSNLGYSTSK
jgi:hypothetical protein